MSLYEINSMIQAIDRRTKNIVLISDEDWEENNRMLRELAARDPSVRLN